MSDLFDRRLPAVFSYISNNHRFPTNPTVKSLETLRTAVNVDYATAQDEYSRLIKLWGRAELELSQARGRHNSPPPKRMLELEKAEASTHDEVADFKKELLNLRRAEELTRVLPDAFAGDTEASHWFSVLLSRVEKYTPGLPA